MRRLLLVLVCCAWASGGASAQLVGQVGSPPAVRAQTAAPLLPVRPIPLRLSATTTAPVSVTATWDPNPPDEQVTVYRLYYGLAPATYTFTPLDVAAPATTLVVPGLTPGVTYYFALQARTATATSALSLEVAFTVGDPRCLPVTGDRAVSIFPTALRLTGSGGAGSQARLDFQIASPGSPVNAVIVQSGALVLNTLTGVDLGALAGMWFSVPTPSGNYLLSVTASNVYGCSKTQSTTFSVPVP